jgi:hypothetical protein
VVVVPAGPGVDKNVVVRFLCIGLDDLFVGEYVVQVGQGLGVRGLWVGVEIFVHRKFR